MPAFYEPPTSLTAGVPQLWIMTSGGENYGGCDAYVSRDATNYFYIGTMDTPSQQGALTAPLPSGPDPDTTDTLAVDMTISLSALFTGVTQTDADEFNTISLIDQEIISYGTVTPTGTYSAGLTYLRRGVYNSTPAAHLAGARFTRINPSSALIWPLPRQYVGQILYFKFCSFNVFGQQTEDLSTVTEYTYAPIGVAYAISPPTNVTLGTAASPQLSAVIGWTASPGPSLGSYLVELSQDGGVTWPIAVTVGNGSTSVIIAPIVGGTNYGARVAAISQGSLAQSSWAYSPLLLGGNIPAWSHPGRSATMAEINRAWDPPAPDAMQGGGQPTAPRRINPASLNVPVSAVVFRHPARTAAYQAEVAQAWMPADPLPTIWPKKKRV